MKKKKIKLKLIKKKLKKKKNTKKKTEEKSSFDSKCSICRNGKIKKHNSTILPKINKI